MHFLKIHFFRCINAVGCVKKRHAPRCIHKMQAILSMTRCTHLMMLYLDRMSQCGLHAVNWSHLGILMRRLAAEPRSIAGLLFPSQCPSGTILLTQYSLVWDWRVSWAAQCFFIGLVCSISTVVFYYFYLPLLSVYIGWYCGAGVFRLIGFIPLFLNLALPTSFNNNNNDNI